MTTPTPTTTPAQPEATKGTAADGKTELFSFPGQPLMVRAVDFNRLHAQVAALTAAQSASEGAAGAEFEAAWSEVTGEKAYLWSEVWGQHEEGPLPEHLAGKYFSKATQNGWLLWRAAQRASSAQAPAGAASGSCPFCGSEQTGRTFHKGCQVIECQNCLARGPQAGDADAAKAGWVTRAPTTTPHPSPTAQPAPAAGAVAGPAWKLGQPITEEMHVAAVKVLHRASGLDGLPQRMLDAMLSAAPTPAAQQGEAELHNALQLAVDHIDMDALSISHCKDAEAIRAALAQKEDGHGN